MGSTKEHTKIIAECSIPVYCIKILGNRHILIGGGGGSAKTGVLNQLQLYLLTYASEFNLKTGRFMPRQFEAQMNSSIDTAEFSNMNMDSILLDNEPERGRYLVAVGQDKFCTLYETTGFCLNIEAASGLTMEFRTLVRIATDNLINNKDSYQKCVRLFRTQRQNLKMLTAGTAGYVRLWPVSKLVENLPRRQKEPSEIPELKPDAIPEFEVPTGKGPVDEIDVSKCGQIMATVQPQSTILWELAEDNCTQVFTLPTEGGPGEAISNKFKIRTLRFTGLDRTRKCAVFITAHNQRVRTSKEVSHLVLWSYSKAKRTCRLVQSQKACKESISCLELSDCQQFAAVGTIGGSVAIFDTQTLNSLLMLREIHSSFVTALAFFPQKTYDVKDLGRIDVDKKVPNLPPGRCFLPGICATSRASIVSIGVDKRILVHELPFPVPSTLTGSLLRLTVCHPFLYFVLGHIYSLLTMI